MGAASREAPLVEAGTAGLVLGAVRHRHHQGRGRAPAATRRQGRAQSRGLGPPEPPTRSNKRRKLLRPGQRGGLSAPVPGFAARLLVLPLRPLDAQPAFRRRPGTHGRRPAGAARPDLRHPRRLAAADDRTCPLYAGDWRDPALRDEHPGSQDQRLRQGAARQPGASHLSHRSGSMGGGEALSRLPEPAAPARVRGGARSSARGTSSRPRGRRQPHEL